MVDVVVLLCGCVWKRFSIAKVVVVSGKGFQKARSFNLYLFTWLLSILSCQTKVLLLLISDAPSYHNRNTNGSHRSAREKIQAHGLINIDEETTRL